MFTPYVQDSLGKRLQDARDRKGMNVKDAAFVTRIPVERILEMENDDYSNFANFTYAKSFLRLYGNSLDIDLTASLKDFDSLRTDQDEGEKDYFVPSGTEQYMAAMAEAEAQAGSWWRKGLSKLPSAVLVGGAVWLCAWLYQNKDAAMAETAPVQASQVETKETQPAAAPAPGEFVTPNKGLLADAGSPKETPSAASLNSTALNGPEGPLGAKQTSAATSQSPSPSPTPSVPASVTPTSSAASAAARTPVQNAALNEPIEQAGPPPSVEPTPPVKIQVMQALSVPEPESTKEPTTTARNKRTRR